MSSFHRLTTALAALSTLGFVLGSAQAATPSVVKVQLDNTGKVETLKLDRTSVPAGISASKSRTLRWTTRTR